MWSGRRRRAARGRRGRPGGRPSAGPSPSRGQCPTAGSPAALTPTGQGRVPPFELTASRPVAGPRRTGGLRTRTYGRAVTSTAPSAPAPTTLGELRASGRVPAGQGRDPRQPAGPPRGGRDRLPGIVGFEDTVVPEVERALIAGHDLVLLGERGQGKTRLIRTLVGLLDEWTPVLVGSELNEHPYSPISPWGAPADRRARRRHPGRLAAPQRPVRREAGHAGHQRRRPHRRRRPDQGRRGPHARRPRDRALRPGPAHQPRHLQRQRAARPRRAHPGRAAQRAGGARHPDPRLPAAAAAGPAARGQRQPRGLHQPRPDHHAAQGPLRRRGAHALPARAGRRDPAAPPGGAARAGRATTVDASPTTCWRSSPASPGWSASPARSTSAPASAPASPSPAETVAASAVRRAAIAGEPARWPGSCDLPASSRPAAARSSSTPAEEDRELEVLAAPAPPGDRRRPSAPAAPAATSPACRSTSTAGETVETGDLVPAAALLGQLGTRARGWPSCWAASACRRARSRRAGRRRASSSRSRGCYLTRRLAKDTDGARTVYGPAMSAARGYRYGRWRGGAGPARAAVRPRNAVDEIGDSVLAGSGPRRGAARPAAPRHRRPARPRRPAPVGRASGCARPGRRAGSTARCRRSASCSTGAGGRAAGAVPRPGRRRPAGRGRARRAARRHRRRRAGAEAVPLALRRGPRRPTSRSRTCCAGRCSTASSRGMKQALENASPAGHAGRQGHGRRPVRAARRPQPRRGHRRSSSTSSWTSTASSSRDTRRRSRSWSTPSPAAPPRRSG